MHDCNVDSMNSLNTHDANDMQSHKLGEAMFDIFCPPSFDVQIYYDESMPPIYDDYNDESGFGVISFLCFCVMKRMLYVMVLLFNFFMMLLKITMQEELMPVGIAIISSFLSMC